MLENFVAFFAKLHPLIVHLPIGMFFLLLGFEWVSSIPKHVHLRSAVNPIAFWTFATSIVSCFAGYFLSYDGSYPTETMDRHFWLGISFAVFSGGYYLASKFQFFSPLAGKLSTVFLLVILSLTGHFGGSLTHGEGYLEESVMTLFESTPVKIKRKPVQNIDEALLYADLIEPIFEKKCFKCHNQLKQKGRFRMDVAEKLMNGGKNGPAISAGNPNQSLLHNRIILPVEDKHHMPPKNSKQLTSNEIEVIQWWIEKGASFDKRLAQLEGHEKIRHLFLTGNQKEGEDDIQNSVDEFAGIVPTPAKSDVVVKLRKLNISIE